MQESSSNFSNVAAVVCCAVNTVGSDVWRARLSVKLVDQRPPPVILHGPANQTLPLKSIAVLPCKAVGSPTPTVRWFKNGQALSTNHRIDVSEHGTLQIKGKFHPRPINISTYLTNRTAKLRVHDYTTPYTWIVICSRVLQISNEAITEFTRVSRIRKMVELFGARICGWNRRPIQISAFFDLPSRRRIPDRRPGQPCSIEPPTAKALP